MCEKGLKTLININQSTLKITPHCCPVPVRVSVLVRSVPCEREFREFKEYRECRAKANKAKRPERHSLRRLCSPMTPRIAVTLRQGVASGVLSLSECLCLSVVSHARESLGSLRNIGSVGQRPKRAKRPERHSLRRLSR